MTDRLLIPQANPHASYQAQRAEIDAAVARVLDSGRYILGGEVAAFEAEFAAYLGIKHAIGVANGTDALELALRALDIGSGHAVIAPSHTAVATVAAIERAGARPVLIDVDPQTYCITAAAVEEVAKSRHAFAGCPLKAVIPVHLYGNPVDMPAIVDVAGRYGLRVIEDCAQSHGARLEGRRTGAFGDLAAFSFYPTKNLGAFGDGGLVATNDAQLADRLRALRQYGWQERSVSSYPGINSRLDEIQAAILRAKLTRLDADNERRREIARRYATGLEKAAVRLSLGNSAAEQVFHQFVIRTERRDELRAFLEQKGIGTAIHYPVPVHRQPAYRDRGLTAGPLPVTETVCAEILSLPMYPQFADADVDRVIATIVEGTQSRSPNRKGSAT
jgi:dTDP-4-amino-4,6-dideoxygalactose transaminase